MSRANSMLIGLMFNNLRDHKVFERKAPRKTLLRTLDGSLGQKKSQPNLTRFSAGRDPPGNCASWPPIEIEPRSMPKKPI